MIALMLGSPATAGTAWVDFCGTYNADYDDVGTVITQLDDDWFVDNDPRAARGAKLTVHDNDLNFTYVIRLADDAVTCPNGNQCACAGAIPLDDLHTYNLKVWADVAIGSNAFQVRDDDTSEAVWVAQGPTAWSPVSGKKVLTTGQHAAWRIAAAAGWALHRRQTVVCDDPFTFYTQNCPGEEAGTSCQNPGGKVYISGGQNDLKYVIAHEEGHWMSVCANDGVNDANLGTNETFDGSCTSADGSMVQKRNAGHAAIEGIAWYWAAVAFNDTTEADCEFSESADYDQDGTLGEQVDDERSASCEGGTANSWAGLDYLANECGGTLEDRGTEYDYLRAFWDAEQGQGLTTFEVFRIYAEADPENWDGDGGGLFSSDDPQERLEAAADANLVLTEWNNVDGANGVR